MALDVRPWGFDGTVIVGAHSKHSRFMQHFKIGFLLLFLGWKDEGWWMRRTLLRAHQSLVQTSVNHPVGNTKHKPNSDTHAGHTGPRTGLLSLHSTLATSFRGSLSGNRTVASTYCRYPRLWLRTLLIPKRRPGDSWVTALTWKVTSGNVYVSMSSKQADMACIVTPPAAIPRKPGETVSIGKRICGCICNTFQDRKPWTDQEGWAEFHEHLPPFCFNARAHHWSRPYPILQCEKSQTKLLFPRTQRLGILTLGPVGLKAPSAWWGPLCWPEGSLASHGCCDAHALKKTLRQSLTSPLDSLASFLISEVVGLNHKVTDPLLQATPLMSGLCGFQKFGGSLE